MLPYPVSPRVSSEIDDLAASFARSSPVRPVVIDNFLECTYAHEFYNYLPDLTAMPKWRDYICSNKRAGGRLTYSGEDTIYNREVLGSAGHFVAANPDATATMVLQMMESPAVVDESAQSNVQRAQQHYSWKQVCSDYENALPALI